MGTVRLLNRCGTGSDDFGVVPSCIVHGQVMAGMPIAWWERF